MLIRRTVRWLDMVPVCPRQAHAGTVIQPGAGLACAVPTGLSALRQPAPCQAVPAERRAGAVLGTPRFLDDRIDAIPAARMARYIPDCTTFRISLFRVGSETALWNRTHFFSSSVGRYAFGTSMPPSSLRQREELWSDTPKPRQVSPTVRPWLGLALASRSIPLNCSGLHVFRFVLLFLQESELQRSREIGDQGGSLSRIRLTRNCSIANGRNGGASFNARKLPPNSVPKIRAITPRLHQQSYQ